MGIQFLSLPVTARLPCLTRVLCVPGHDYPTAKRLIFVAPGAGAESIQLPYASRRRRDTGKPFPVLPAVPWPPPCSTPMHFEPFRGLI